MTTMKPISVTTSPVWDDNGTIRLPAENEVRSDLADHVIGWANVLVFEHQGQRLRVMLTGEGIENDSE